MGSLLASLFGFIIIIFAFLLVFLASIIRKARNIMSQFSPTDNSTRTSHSTQNDRKTGSSKRNASQEHKKIFEDNEGEYVDFEEIK